MKPSEGWFGSLHARVWEEAAKTHPPEVDKLAHSQRMRELVVAGFGGIPSSFWPHDYSLDFPDPVKDEKENRLSLYAGQTGDEGIDRNQYGKQPDEGGRLSRFEGRLALSCVKLWSNPGDLVLDPFAGRAARLEACLRLGRSYVGFDPSDDAARAYEATVRNHAACVAYSEEGGVRVRRAVVLSELGTPSATQRDAVLVQRSSLYIGDHYGPESVDAVFTCPPYWCSEFYGDSGEGSEAIPTYGDFLEELVACLLGAGKALKPGRFMVVVLRGFHIGGHFLDLPGHVANALAAAGYYLHDDIAKKMGTLRERFHQDILKWRRTAQTHERVLVFWKPDRKPRYSFSGYHVAAYNKGKRRRAEDARLFERRWSILREAGVVKQLQGVGVPYPEEYLDLRRKAAAVEANEQETGEPGRPEESDNGG